MRYTLIIATLVLAGCAGGDAAPEVSTVDTAPGWMLAQAPDSSVAVASIKATAAEGDTVAVRGRIGPRRNFTAFGFFSVSDRATQTRHVAGDQH